MLAGHDGMNAQNEPAPQGLHVLAKPIGPVCNIACDYPFYLEKHALFGKGENYP